LSWAVRAAHTKRVRHKNEVVIAQPTSGFVSSFLYVYSLPHSGESRNPLFGFGWVRSEAISLVTQQVSGFVSSHTGDPLFSIAVPAIVKLAEELAKNLLSGKSTDITPSTNRHGGTNSIETHRKLRFGMTVEIGSRLRSNQRIRDSVAGLRQTFPTNRKAKKKPSGRDA